MKKNSGTTIFLMQNGGGNSFLNVIVRKYRAYIFAGVLAGFWGMIFLCAQNVVLSQPAATADGPLVDETHDPQTLTATETDWGAFKIGSGIRKRTTTTFLEKATQGVTESMTTLEAVESDGILLKQIDSVEIGGKMVQGEPQQKKIDFYRQQMLGNGGAGTGQILPSERIQIGNRVFLCGVRVYEQTTPQFRRLTKVWFNPKVAPYVLRTEVKRLSLPTAEQPSEILLGHSIFVVLNPPKTTLRGSFFGTYKTQTIRRNADGTAYSLAECSLRVPGWVESEKSWEYDRENNLVLMRSTVSSSITNK